MSSRVVQGLQVRVHSCFLCVPFYRCITHHPFIWNKGATTILNSSCSGPYSCSSSSGIVIVTCCLECIHLLTSNRTAHLVKKWCAFNFQYTGTTSIGSNSCGKAHACENVTGEFQDHALPGCKFSYWHFTQNCGVRSLYFCWRFSMHWRIRMLLYKLSKHDNTRQCVWQPVCLQRCFWCVYSTCYAIILFMDRK